MTGSDGMAEGVEIPGSIPGPASCTRVLIEIAVLVRLDGLNPGSTNHSR